MGLGVRDNNTAFPRGLNKVWKRWSIRCPTFRRSLRIHDHNSQAEVMHKKNRTSDTYTVQTHSTMYCNDLGIENSTKYNINKALETIHSNR